MKRLVVVLFAVVSMVGAAAGWAWPPIVPSTPGADGSKWAPAVQPKPLSPQVSNALEWLVRTQHPNGGWGQGEEAQGMHGGGELRDVPNVADTCSATLALLRSGSTPCEGTHASNIRRGLDFVCGRIEDSDPSSMYVTDLRGTRLQGKLGPFIDTFLAAMLLSEVKDVMPDANGQARVSQALAKVLEKIEKNQKQDGTWSNEGWAPVLSQAMASKALNRAAQAGAAMPAGVREKAEEHARGSFDAVGGKVAGEGSAGVELYAVAGNLGSLQDADNTNAQMQQAVQRRLLEAKDDKQRDELQKELVRYRETQQELDIAKKAATERLDDARFLAGFGSNGGEEFLSYMNIGESLVVQGGAAWQQWDRKMTDNLNRIQNVDGSWTGHHCITGRTFCTSTALLVLMVDRAPVPMAAKFRRSS